MINGSFVSCNKSDDYVNKYSCYGSLSDNYISTAKSILLQINNNYVDDKLSFKYLGNPICENPPPKAFNLFKDGKKRNQLEVDVIIRQYLTGEILYSSVECYEGFIENFLNRHENEYSTPVNSKKTQWSHKEHFKPRVFVQSALFSAQRLLFSDKDEGMVINKEIASSTNLTINYKGYYLDQCCLDVWTELFFRCQYDVSKEYEVEENVLLQYLNKSGGKYKDWLNNNIKLLTCSYVDMICATKYKNTHYSGPLLKSNYSESYGTYRISFDERIINLFDETGFSISNNDIRKDLKKNHMAKFIYEYVSSRNPTEKSQMISLNTLRTYAWPIKRENQAKEAFMPVVKNAVEKLNGIQSIPFKLALAKSANFKDYNLTFSKK